MNDGPAPKAPRELSGTQALPKQVCYVLAEAPCPYLPGRRERKLITEIPGAPVDQATAKKITAPGLAYHGELPLPKMGSTKR